MGITTQRVSEAVWDDVQTVLGVKGQAARCQCSGYSMGWYAQHDDNVAGRREALHDRVLEGHGAIAHLDGEPVGWVSVAPRIDYTYLRKTTWAGRPHEDRTDPGIWSVTCFVTRAGFRRQGVSTALVRATIDVAREGGATALEAYPMKPAPGAEVTWGDLHVGALSAFLAAGFRVVHAPSLRRSVVRFDW